MHSYLKNKIIIIVSMAGLLFFTGHAYAKTIGISLKSLKGSYWRVMNQSIRETCLSYEFEREVVTPKRYSAAQQKENLSLFDNIDGLIIAPIDIELIEDDLKILYDLGIPIILVDYDSEYEYVVSSLYHDYSAALSRIAENNASITWLSISKKGPSIPPGIINKFQKEKHQGGGAIPGNSPLLIDTHQVSPELYLSLKNRGKSVFMMNISRLGIQALHAGDISEFLQRDQREMGRMAVEMMGILFQGGTVPSLQPVPIEIIDNQNFSEQMDKIFPGWKE